ncbi:C1 family peptidase [Methanobrevibacter sp.]|uniref:C1 family peptidase n=1 Tax=Methanobrevibacter sp. TaxID=66852 RepID=UPI00386C2C1F
MFEKVNKSIFLAALLLFLMIIIPASFAADNGTEMLSYDDTNDTQVVSVPLEEDILSAGEIYFDASAETDGDGSASSPYKELKANRIQANCNLHFANGEYQLDTYRYIDQVNIIGSDVDKTIIKYNGVAFTVNNQLTVKNITFIGASITNRAKFNATNTIFEEGFGSKPDYYGNNYGGAIFTDTGYANAYVNVDNCTFKNNYAVYGGAIFIGSGNLNVYNSLFFNNYAYNYGGAIACEYIGNVTISKSKFYNSKSLADAGGSIYIKQSSKFNADEIEVVNSSSTFGGAITTLNTPVTLAYVNMADNSAKYDGGAIFHMYGNFTLIGSTFNNNSASNGGALFIDNSTSVFVRLNTFTNNKANSTGGAIYSLFNKLSSSYDFQNRYTSNIASYKNNWYDTKSLNLTIGNGNYTMYKADTNPIDSLPSRYSLVDDGYVTSVKDQQTSGNCWAFTAITVLESCILKVNGSQIDLSEENMKNIIALYSDYGWKTDTNEGGYDYMPWGYLASWLGPVNEIDDMFDDKSTLSPLLNSIMHVQNIKFLERSSYTDNDAIKKAILDYGAVGTSIYQDSKYLNTTTNAYYCWYTTYNNHAVTIVGWDDNYSKSNFKYGSSSDIGDGAWIVRNSWASSWGDHGYYYVSYYDKNFARPGDENCAYTIILNDTVRFDKNYQYDIAGITDYFLISSPSVWYKNIFTASSDEYLAAVSTYFEKACNWTASVVVNGEIKDVLSGTTEAGYYTFNLNKFISLKSGDVFEVIFNVTANGGAFFPISEEISLNKLVYSPQSSFVSYDGVTWQDLYNLTWAYSSHTYGSQVACIKAFTYINPINALINITIDFMESRPISISAIITDEFGNLVKYGNVTFNINGENKSASVSNGRASVSYDMIHEGYLISATFDAEGYASSKSALYTVPKINAQIDLEINQYYNNINLTITVDKLINETISLEINGNKIFLELINGYKTLTLSNLANGRYDIYISLMEDSDYGAAPFIANFTISLSKTTIAADDLTTNDEKGVIYNVTLMDEDNNAISGKEITFTIDNITYANRTDENGQAVLVISLNKGVYDVEIAFDGDNYYFKSDAENTIKVKSKVWIDLDIATYKSMAFISVHGSKIINETFTLLVNDNPNYISAKNGSAHLQLRNLSMGVYNVTVLLDDGEFDFNDATSQFTIDTEGCIEIKSSIEMSGDDLIVNIEIANSTGSAVVIIDGNSDVVKLSEGKANYTVENIAPGNHYIVIIYADEYFGETFKSQMFNVPKKESSVELTFNNTKVHQKSTILINVTPAATGIVSVDINGTPYWVNLSQTNALEIIFDNAGEYPIVATYWGDYYYNESMSNPKTLVVSEKSPANIRVEIPDGIKLGDEFVINVTSDSNASLIVKVNGNVIRDIGAEGLLTLSLGNILKATNAYKCVADRVGIYYLTVFSQETDNFASEIYSESFYVDKKDAKLDIVPIANVNVGDKIVIHVENETDGSLTIKVNGETVTGEYEITKAGAYTITVESAATDAYNKGFATYTFEVAEPAEYNITVVVDGKDYNVTVVNGTGTIKTDIPDLIKNLTDELEEVKANASGLAEDLAEANGLIGDLTGELVEAQANASGLAGDLVDAKQNISDLSSQLEEALSNASGLAGDLADANKLIDDLTGELSEVKANASGLAGDLVDANKLIDDLTNQLKEALANATNKTEYVVVDGKEYVVEYVNGTAVVFTDSVNNVTVVIDGKEYPVEVINGTATVTTDPIESVKPIATKIESLYSFTRQANDWSAGERGAMFYAILKDINGNPLANMDCLVAVNGPIYKATTDNQGRFGVQVNLAAANTYTYALSFLGNDQYGASFNSSKLILVAKKTSIAAKDQTFKSKAKTKTVSVTLKTVKNPYDGKTYLKAGKKITLKVNGKTYTAKTNAEGVAKFSIKLTKKGKYTATIKFAGDKTYKASSKNVKINIK